MLSHGSGVSTHCHRPGGHGDLAPVLGQIPPSSLGRGLGSHREPSSSVKPEPPECASAARAPFSPGDGWWVGAVGSGAAMGSHSAPGSQADTSLLLSLLRSSTWRMTRTGSRLSCSAARALSPKTTSRSSHTREYHPTRQATIPIPNLQQAGVVPHVGKLSHRDGGVSASATTARGDRRQQHTHVPPKIQPSHRAATE